MPDTITFDTLAYAKKLRSVGSTEDQAEVQAEALVNHWWTIGDKTRYSCANTRYERNGLTFEAWPYTQA